MKKLVAILIVLFLASPCIAVNYYVRASGTNADPDCSGSSACCAGAMDLDDFNAFSGFSGEDSDTSITGNADIPDGNVVGFEVSGASSPGYCTFLFTVE